MRNYKEKDRKPKIVQVMIFNGSIDDDCTDLSEWIFDLPIERAIEMREKYNIPKYMAVKNDNEKEILLLDFEKIQIEYVLASCNDSWDGYIGDDFRLAEKYDGEETVWLYWGYNVLTDEGYLDTWEGYCGDEYSSVFDNECFDTVWPCIEITGEDKEKLLEELHGLMIEVLDGDPKIKERLYDFCGD